MFMANEPLKLLPTPGPPTNAATLQRCLWRMSH